MTDPLAIKFPRKTDESIMKLREQLKEVVNCETRFTCGCGFSISLSLGFRCLYCGEYFCTTCAERHFGKTRQEHNQSKHGSHKEG